MPKTTYTPEEIAEIDRNARAYGFEVGRGHPLVQTLTVNSPDNPFLDKDWRKNIDKEHAE